MWKPYSKKSKRETKEIRVTQIIEVIIIQDSPYPVKHNSPIVHLGANWSASVKGVLALFSGFTKVEA